MDHASLRMRFDNGERRPEVGVGGLGCSIHRYFTTRAV